MEHYLHEVFARLAAQGHQVLWIAHNHGLFARKSPQLEIVDLIQIARLGSSFLYEITSTMFLKRLKRADTAIGPFDAMFECIGNTPLNLHEHAVAPLLPLVFNLKANIQASDSPPGPVIAATGLARSRIMAAGIPESYIIRAPFGVDSFFYSIGKNRASSPLLAVVEPDMGWFHRDPIYKACQYARKTGFSFDVEVLSARKPSCIPEGFVWRLDEGPETRRELFQRAWIGYCGAGAEHEALAMAACGLPVICPATEQGREYVESDRNGLLFTLGNFQELAGHLEQLIKDEVMLKRLSHHARVWAESQSWDRTASLVLAAVENLSKPQTESSTVDE